MIWLIYILTFLIIVSWSIYLYKQWEHPLNYAEDSPWRFLLMVTPSSIFLLTMFSGFSNNIVIPLDIIGMVLQIILILTLSILLKISSLRGPKSYRRSFVLITISYLLISIVSLIVLFSVRLYPPFLIPVIYLMEEAKNIDLLKSIWPYISPENSSFQSDFLINKVLIAILSYIPVTLLRMIYTAHAQRKLKLQINDLRTDLEDLKKEIHSKK